MSLNVSANITKIFTTQEIIKQSKAVNKLSIFINIHNKTTKLCLVFTNNLLIVLLIVPSTANKCVKL